jgi:hypothetical protein
VRGALDTKLHKVSSDERPLTRTFKRHDCGLVICKKAGILFKIVKNKQENKEKPLQNNKRRLRRQFFREMSTLNQGVAVWQLYISVSWCSHSI